MKITDFGLGEVVLCVKQTGDNFAISEPMKVNTIGDNYLTAISSGTNKEYRFISTERDCKYLKSEKTKTRLLLFKDYNTFDNLQTHVDLMLWFLQNINREMLQSRFTTDQLYRAKAILCGWDNVQYLK